MKPERPSRNIDNNAGQGSELTDLQWTAFRYLADEMTPELAADFEQQLTGNPAAAEALDQMLCLLSEVEATGAGATCPLTSEAKSVPRKAGWTEVPGTVQWLAALAAAVLVLLSISRLFPTPLQDWQQESMEATLEGEQMAELWASSLPEDSGDPAEEPAEDEPEGDEWLYSALVSLESLENWPAEAQGGS